MSHPGTLVASARPAHRPPVSRCLRGLGCFTLALHFCVATSCTIAPWLDATDARDELRACEEAHPDDREACDAHREALHAAYDDYETESRRLWGCDDEPCNTLEND